MRRTVVAVTLVLACAGGAVSGAALHAWGPDALGSRATAQPGTAPTRTPTPTPTRSPAPTAAPTMGRIPSPPVAGATTGPAFTRLALLQPAELTSLGWQVASQVDAYPSLPDAAITPCTTVPTDADGLVAGFAATYASSRTTAAEVVARFASTEQAESAFDAMRSAVAGCVDARPPLDRRRITGFHDASPDRVSELRWWNTRSVVDDSDRGVVGIVRVDDRVALLSMESAERDPAVTTRIEQLLTLAGRRLV